MTTLSGKSLLKWVIKLNFVIWAANLLIFAMFALAVHDANLLTAYFSKILFLETGITFLVGGLIAFSSSVLPSKAREYNLKSREQWSIDTLKKGEKRANKYLLLAIILFIQSIIVSVVGY